MTTIFTYENEQSTCDVIDWLIHYKKNYNRVNSDGTGKIQNISININNDTVVFTDSEHNAHSLKDFSDKLWYRRGELVIEDHTDFTCDNQVIASKLSAFINYEKAILEEFLEKDIKKNSTLLLNSPRDYQINKLLVLQEAKEAGLKIPDTLITTEKYQVDQFYRKHSKVGVITKPILNGISIETKDEYYSMYTENVNEEDIVDLDKYFFPTLFQEKIPKLFELRVFYLYGEFYPMAIFSFGSNEDDVDTRRIKKYLTYRRVPYKLDSVTRKAITSMMAALKLNSGSIDMIYSKENGIYFLEVNPVGQFGKLSQICNYYVEKHIAKIL